MERRGLWSIVRVLVLAAVSFRASADTISAMEFTNAINMAGRQRMLSQRMSKEFFLIAKGHEVAENKDALQASIALFDSSLSKLIGGSAADGIPAAPSANSLLELNRVSSLWLPFKGVLEENMSKSPIPAAAIDFVVRHNIPLLKQANVVVGRLVDAAKGAGVATAGLQVDTAGRQRMLSQRMAKEVMMIALDIDVRGTLEALRGTMDLFAASHKGLMLGRDFLGLPETRNICTLQQMRVVTGLWVQFRSLLQQIIYGSGLTPAIMKDIADLNPVLLREMNSAVTLYVTKSSNCPQSFLEGDWLRALHKASHGQHVLWNCRRLLIQLAAGVDAVATSTLLLGRFATAEAHLRTIVEGSVPLQIRSPATQAIADEFLDGWSDYAHFQDSAMSSVGSQQFTQVDLERSLEYGMKSSSKLERGFELYSQAAAAGSAQLPISAVGLAKELGVAAERMVIEAFLGHTKRDLSSAYKVQVASATFERTMDELVKGRPAAAGAPAVNRTSEACALRQMQKVAAQWEPLAASAARFAAGATAFSSEELSLLSKHANDVYEPLRAVVSLYTFGPQNCDISATGAQWEAMIWQSGRLVALSEVVLTEQAMAARGLTLPWSGSRLRVTNAEIGALVNSLTYGDTSKGLPSPPTQDIADSLFRLKGFLEAGDARRLSAASPGLLSEAEALQGLYVQGLQQAQGTGTSAALVAVAPERILAATRQLALVERLARVAAEMQPGRGGAAALRQDMSTFEATHRLLLDGTPGLARGAPGYLPVTSEYQIMPQMQQVFDALGPVKAQVDEIASAGHAGNDALAQLSLDVRGLAVETERMLKLYGTASQLAEVSELRLIVPLPLTGSWAPGGVMRVAATVAEEIINRQQRIAPGIHIKASFVDDQCNDREGMRHLLEKVSSNTSWAGLGGMGCSSVCGATALVASSVRMPAVGFACAGSSLSDTNLYPDFVRLGTPLTGTAGMIVNLARRFGWGHLEVMSDTTHYHPQNPNELVADLREGGLSVHWESFAAGSARVLKTKAAALVAQKRRQVLLLGNENFARSVVCACLVAGMSPGMTWITSGPKRRGWLQEDDADITAIDARCSGAALSEYMQGTLNIRATGVAAPELEDAPLDCLEGHTPRSFLDAVDQRLASMNSSAQQEAYGTLDRYDGVAGLAADGMCVFAYAFRALQDLGYAAQDMQSMSETVYQQTTTFIRDRLSFMGVSGNVTFSGNDKPGDLGLWQYLGTSNLEVGIQHANGTTSLELHGGPSDRAWRPHPPQPPGAQIPVEAIAAIVLGGMVVVACIAGAIAGRKASASSAESKGTAGGFSSSGGSQDSAGSKGAKGGSWLGRKTKTRADVEAGMAR